MPDITDHRIAAVHDLSTRINNYIWIIIIIIIIKEVQQGKRLTSAQLYLHQQILTFLYLFCFKVPFSHTI